MAITSGDIRSIITNYMQRGRWYHIGDIQALVRKHYNLSQEDLKPHTNTRPTFYPVWKHRIQGVLSQMKRRGTIIHDERNQTYLLP